jgi:YD repeat-containing protein
MARSRFAIEIRRAVVLIVLLGCIGTLDGEAQAQQVVQYTYDAVGRVTSALYDNGVCVVYSYDANGNRTSKTVLAAGTPNTPTWGTGTLGCFQWS